MQIKLDFHIKRTITFSPEEEAEAIKNLSAKHGDISTKEIFERIIEGIKERPIDYLIRPLAPGEQEEIRVESSVE